MPFRVFLSHSSTDKPAFEELARRLAKEGIQAWLDKWHLIPGNPRQPEIEKALQDSRFFILIADPLSAQSEWVQKEVAYWLGMERRKLAYSLDGRRARVEQGEKGL
jgi:hypothetical protein